MASDSKIIWSNGRFMPWQEASTHPIGQGLHYGLGVFEGIRFYDTSRGPAIFRLPEHLERLFYSAKVLHIAIPYSADEIVEIIKTLIQKNEMVEGYIRPCFFYGGGNIGLNVHASTIESVIEVRSWNNPPKEFLRVKTSPYRRIDPRSSDVNAKICGHYVNSFLARLEAEETGFDETILLDARGYAAEASVENIFAVRRNMLFTPPLGTILPGITRSTVMTIARDRGLAVKEKNMRVRFLAQSDEVFLCGTAMEILAVGSIDSISVGDGKMGRVTQTLKTLYREIVHGRCAQYTHWLTFVI